MEEKLSPRRRLYDRGMRGLVWLCAGLTCALLLFLIGYIFYRGVPGITWSLLTSQTSYIKNTVGILPNILDTLYIIVVAMVIVLPLGVGAAIYLTEYASNRRLVSVIEFATETLTGIPSIIYGFFGMVIIRPFIAQLTGGLGFGALTAWFVLAIMIVPTITTLTIDALNSIPMGIREASYAMGATKWQTIYKVVLPAAKLGIVDAIVLGMGRAIGETMAVLMVVGNAPVIPDSISSPISTLTSQIALDMSYSSGLHRSALFGMGVVLFIISAALVGIVRLISKKRG